MTSVVSGESRLTVHSTASKGSTHRNRSSSAYGQRKQSELTAKQQEEYSKMMEEARMNEEKHKQMMKENLMRRKAKAKELEDEERKKQEKATEILVQRKNEKQEAYQKFLKKQEEQLKPGISSISKPPSGKRTKETPNAQGKDMKNAPKNIFDELHQFGGDLSPEQANLLEALDISSSMYNIDKILAKNERDRDDRENSKPEPLTKPQPIKKKGAIEQAKDIATDDSLEMSEDESRKRKNKDPIAKPQSDNILKAPPPENKPAIKANPKVTVDEKNFWEDGEDIEERIARQKGEKPKMEELTSIEQLKEWNRVHNINGQQPGMNVDSALEMSSKQRGAPNGQEKPAENNELFSWAKPHLNPLENAPTAAKPKPPSEIKSQQNSGGYNGKPQLQPLQRQATTEEINLPGIQKTTTPQHRAGLKVEGQPGAVVDGKKNVVIETNIKATQNKPKKDIPPQHPQSKADARPRRAELKAAQGRRAHHSSGRNKEKSSVSTRDEDINIEEFLKYDLINMNQQEMELQKELLAIHRATSQKIKMIEAKHDIQTNYQRTDDLINKRVQYGNRPPIPEAEDELEQSLMKLEQLLAKQRNRCFSAGVPFSKTPGSIPTLPPINQTDYAGAFNQVNKIPPQQKANLQGMPKTIQPLETFGRAPQYQQQFIPPPQPQQLYQNQFPPQPQRFGGSDPYAMQNGGCFQPNPRQYPQFDPHYNRPMPQGNYQEQDEEEVQEEIQPPENNSDAEFDEEIINMDMKKQINKSEIESVVSSSRQQKNFVVRNNKPQLGHQSKTEKFKEVPEEKSEKAPVAATKGKADKVAAGGYANLKEKREKLKYQSENPAGNKNGDDDNDKEPDEAATQEGKIKINKDLQKLLFD